MCSSFILLITTLPGLLLMVLGFASDLAGDALVFEADWVRIVFIMVGGVVGVLGLRGLVRTLRDAKDDKEARLKRAPFVATGLVGSGLALLAVALVSGTLSGQGAEPLHVLVGIYGVWLLLFGVPAFFARKLDKMAPQATPVDPNAPRTCGRCGRSCPPGAPACHYCGAAVA